MKKYVVSLVCILIVQICMGYYIINNRNNISMNPFQTNMAFEGISFITSDSQNNLYAIDKSKKRIIKINKDFEVEYKIEEKFGIRKTFKNIEEIVADDEGNLYSMNTILDERGFYVVSEEIVKYDSQGNMVGTVYKIEYPKSKLKIRTGSLKSLMIKDKYIYFYNVENNYVDLMKASLETGENEKVFKMNLLENTFINEIIGTDLGKIYYSTKKGEIYKVDTLEQQNIIYNGQQNMKFSRSLPIFVNSDKEGYLYFIDINNKCILKLNSKLGNSTEKIFSVDDLTKAGYGIDIPAIEHFYLGKSNEMIMVMSDNIINMDKDAKINYVKNSAEYWFKIFSLRLLIWIFVMAEVILMIRVIYLVYFRIMNKKVYLLLKQVLVFVPIVITSIIVVASMMYSTFIKQYEAELDNNLSFVLKSVSSKIHVEDFKNIKSPTDYMGESYKRLREDIQSLFSGKSSSQTNSTYVATYKYENGQLYACSYLDDSVSSYYPIYSNDNHEYIKVAETGEIITSKSEEASGMWMYTLGPIYDENKNIIGICEVGTDMNRFINYKNNLVISVGKIILCVVALIILIFSLMTYYFLHSIRKVNAAVKEMASGNFDITLSVKSNDEGAELCQGFNIMSKYISEYVDRITLLNEAYYKFVPKQYFNMLGKESIIDVKLGNQVKTEMSILTLNIREFFVISEAMTPEENFEFINSFLEKVSPMIMKNNGFVDRYLGAGIVALFPNRPEDAVNAALNIIKVHKDYNKELVKSGRKPIDIGIGIHKGPLMIGMIGDEKRLEGTVISDNVNLATSLEKVSDKFGAYVLITSDIVESISERESVQYRFIGLVRLEGKEEPVRIYDLYQEDDEKANRFKQETKVLFENGVSLYQEGKFFEARNKFLEVIKKNHEDKAAKVYYFSCNEHLNKEIGADWKGILNI